MEECPVRAVLVCGYSWGLWSFWSSPVSYLILVKMELFCIEKNIKLLPYTIPTPYFCSYSAVTFYFINHVPISRGSMSEM